MQDLSDFYKFEMPKIIRNGFTYLTGKVNCRDLENKLNYLLDSKNDNYHKATVLVSEDPLNNSWE